MSILRDVIPLVLAYEFWPDDLLEQMDEDIIKIAAKTKLSTRFNIPYKESMEILKKAEEDLNPDEKAQNLYVLVAWIENGGDVHFANDTAIRLASEKKRYDIVKFLLLKGAQASVKTFEDAAVSGDKEFRDYLLDNHLDLLDSFVSKELLTICCREGWLEVVKLLIENYQRKIREQKLEKEAQEKAEDEEDAKEEKLREEEFDEEEEDLEILIEMRRERRKREKEERKRERERARERDREIRERHWMRQRREMEREEEFVTVSDVEKAAQNGHIDIVNYLRRFVDIREMSDDCIVELASSGKLQALKTMFDLLKITQKTLDEALTETADKKAYEGNSKIYSKEEYYDIIVFLISKGADVHKDEDISLLKAVRRNQKDVIRYLLHHGANVHADSDQSLDSAVENGSFEMVKMLVKRGIDIHNDWSSLSNAVAQGHYEIAEFLLEIGANVHEMDDQVFDLTKDGKLRALLERYR